jgi:hypothetical protein
MDPLFRFQRLNNNGHAVAGSVAKSFDRLVTRLRKKIKPCREVAIAEMHLEQACFFLKKAISVDPDNHYVTKKQQKILTAKDAKDAKEITGQGAQSSPTHKNRHA